MTQPLPTAVPPDDETILAVVANGDCAKLSDDQKRRYYVLRCQAAGIDPRTAPFEFIVLNGKLQLYARKGATEQLTRLHQISHEVRSEKRTADDIYEVWVRATDPSGRFTDELGAVNVAGVKGEALCNAKMKAVTKAKRRATLSHCGLGMLDETELETIPNGRKGPTLTPPRQLVPDHPRDVIDIREQQLAPPEPPPDEPTPEEIREAFGLTADPVVEYADDVPFTKAELAEFFGACRAAGKTDLRTKEWLKNHWGITNRTQLRRKHYSEAMEWARVGN